MTSIRIIARLDVKAPNLIKGVHLEGLRKLGDPQTFAEKYYNEGIDEILYIDSVASLYERNTIVDIVLMGQHIHMENMIKVFFDNVLRRKWIISLILFKYPI